MPWLRTQSLIMGHIIVLSMCISIGVLCICQSLAIYREMILARKSLFYTKISMTKSVYSTTAIQKRISILLLWAISIDSRRSQYWTYYSLYYHCLTYTDFYHFLQLIEKKYSMKYLNFKTSNSHKNFQDFVVGGVYIYYFRLRLLKSGSYML